MSKEKMGAKGPKGGRFVAGGGEGLDKGWGFSNFSLYRNKRMNALSAAQQKFILHWGEMGTRWGINRTVAQIHALLFILKAPLPADEITVLLGVARSNVSNSIRELQNWGIIRTVHKVGDRRDHFESMHDVWEMFRVIVDERQKREIEPTLALLRDCLAEAEEEKAEDDGTTKERLQAMLDFFQLTTTWYQQMRHVPTSIVLKVLKMGDRVLKLLPLGKAGEK
jgi:DNA-binding transcriptional regulator GbsR (MarR family)